MKTNWMCRASILAVALGVLVSARAFAQEGDQGAGGDELKQVQADLADLKTEMAGVRADLTKVLAELKAVRAAQAKSPRQPQQRKPDTTVYKIDIGDSPVRGPKDAPVTIVEFVDFQCPYCTREAPVIKQVLEAYPKDVRWVFKHFPLGFHKQAKPAHAAAALAAKQQGNDGFWKFHDLITANPKKLSIPDLRAHAESIGLDLDKFDALMGDASKINATVTPDMTAARKYGVRGTPTVFINGLKLSPRGIENYKKRIDQILKGKGKTG